MVYLSIKSKYCSGYHIYRALHLQFYFELTSFSGFFKIIYHDPESRPKVTALEIMIGEHQIKPIKPNAVITLCRA